MRGGTSSCSVVRALITQGTDINAAEQVLACTEQDGRDGQVHLVDKGSPQILPDCGYAAAQSDVEAVRRMPRLLERGVNTFGDKMKHGAALHGDWRSRVMSQDEDRRVIRWLVTPPALPAVIQPRTPDGAEHVSTENPGADPCETLRRNRVVCAGFAVVASVHLAPGPRVEEPVKQCRTADSERVLQILTRSSTIPVD